MNIRWVSSWLAIAIVCAFVSRNAFANSDMLEKVQAALYTGQTAQAASIAQARLTGAPDDAEARFTLGAVQFLQAIEHLGQALYRYGLQSSYEPGRPLPGPGLGNLANLPILRLPVPENVSPQKLTYEALRSILDGFVGDLQTAESTLSKIDSDEIHLPLNIGLIRLDFNGDGKGSDDETLWRMFRVVADANWLDAEAAKSLLVDFDGSDVPWLRAYCHLLMAIAEFPLAYGWQHGFEATFHGLFPKAGLPFNPNDQEPLAKLKALGEPPTMCLDCKDTDAWRDWELSPKGQKYRQYWYLRERIDMGGIADLVAFVHLTHWPVVEPERLRHVLSHLEAMVQNSRASWKLILAETDDHNEWIPSPKQTGVLPQMLVTQERVDGWMQFLDEFEAVLEGRKLIPHWRFDQGINMRRFFLEPSTLDIVLLLQGSAAVPYLEDGDLTTGETWDQISRLFGGEFFRYFIWIN